MPQETANWQLVFTPIRRDHSIGMVTKPIIWSYLPMQICQSYIGGRSQSSNQPPIDKFYAATGEVIAKIEPATNKILDKAVSITSKAQRSWATLEAGQRGKIL